MMPNGSRVPPEPTPALGPARATHAVEAPRRTDVVEVGEVARSLRLRWRTIAAVTLLSVAAAGAVLLLAPRRFEGAATVLLRSRDDAGTSLLGRLGIPADLAPSGLGSAMKSPMETELEILGSRALLAAVSDSLGLQVRVLAPAGVPPWALLAPRAYPGAFRKLTLAFTRDGDGYRVRGEGVDGRVAPGRPLATPVGEIALADGPLPPSFEVQVLDREDALERLEKRVNVSKAGGEVARVDYAAPDSLSAAAVPNALVAKYLLRRRTTDRGVNQHRVEFLERQADSVDARLAEAERALRDFQERSGVLEPGLMAKLDLEGASRLREQIAANQVERVALEQMLRDVASGSLGTRQLAAYPSLLKSPAINELLAQLTKLETERTTLLERRTEADPEVVALAQSIANLEGQLRPLGTAYAASLARQRAELDSLVGRFDAALDALPAGAQEFGRRNREVARLGQTSIALQTQLLEARLAAVGEGGDVRQVDVAFAPKRPAFPRPIPVLGIGLGAGLLLGVVGALVAGVMSPRVGSAADAMRLLGVPAAAVGEGNPLFFAAVRRSGVIAIAPLTGGVDAARVARWLIGGTAPARQGATAASTVPVPVDAGGAVAVAEFSGSGDGAGYAPGTRAVSTLPPLDAPAGFAEIVPSLPVLLACAVGTASDDLVQAAAALDAAGAELVAVAIV